jgi:hypothetical protein
MNSAVNAADVYFAGLGSQQMASMSLNGPSAAVGGDAAQSRFVVNQNQQQPEAMPGGATGELLLI